MIPAVETKSLPANTCPREIGAKEQAQVLANGKPEMHGGRAGQGKICRQLHTPNLTPVGCPELQKAKQHPRTQDGCAEGLDSHIRNWG
jgi:hypothetical protein